MKNKNTNYEEIEMTPEQFEIINQIRTESNPRNDLRKGSREILIVNNHNIISANWQISSNNTTKLSQNVIILTGNPSPSSKVEKAYIYFTSEDSQIQAPRYIDRRKVIAIYLHYRNLKAVLEQLKQNKIYCWIGHFPNGHIYANIHTSHI